MKTTERKNAMILFQKGNYQAAAGAFKLCLAKDEYDTKALFYLALSMYELRQFRRSLQYWKRLEKINPVEANLHLNMGCAYQNLHRNDLAIRNFKRELQINPVSGETLYSLGTLYYNAHNYKSAVGYLERCFALKHSVDQIVDRLAYSYFKTGQIENELALYENYLKSQPDDIWCLNNMGAALMHLGEYNRAQLYLQRAACINSKDATVIKNLKKVKRIRSKGKAIRPTAQRA